MTGADHREKYTSIILLELDRVFLYDGAKAPSLRHHFR